MPKLAKFLLTRLFGKEQFRICVVHYELGTFDTIIAEWCNGPCNYISETTVAIYSLREKNGYVVVRWCYPNQGRLLSDTLCKVVPDEKIPGLNIAFGKNCGKEDAEATDRETRRMHKLSTKTHDPEALINNGLTSTTMHDRSEQVNGFDEVFPRDKYQAINTFQQRGDLTAMSGNGQAQPLPTIGQVRNPASPVLQQRGNAYAYDIPEEDASCIHQRVMLNVARMNVASCIQLEREASQQSRSISRHNPAEVPRRGQGLGFWEGPAIYYDLASPDESGGGYRQ